MLGSGIDTGGTWTDAVICDLETNAVLASGKAQTTHDDLKSDRSALVQQFLRQLFKRFPDADL